MGLLKKSTGWGNVTAVMLCVIGEISEELQINSDVKSSLHVLFQSFLKKVA